MRAAIRSEVEQIHALDDAERRAQIDVLRWVDSGVELCRLQKPATPPKHLISYFAVVDDDYVLLVDHINAGLWLPSGGHVEPGEHPRDTVRRECREELGVEARELLDGPLFLTVTETVGSTAGHTDVSLWYVLKGSRSDHLEFDRNEFNGIQWFHRDAAPLDRADPELGRFLRKLYLRKQKVLSPNTPLQRTGTSTSALANSGTVNLRSAKRP